LKLKYFITYVLAGFAALSCAHAQSQLVGKITEAGKGIPVPFAHVLLKGTYVGNVSDTNGVFKLSGNFKPADSLKISAVGYHPQTVAVSLSDTIRIVLAPTALEINSIEIVAGENPAIILLKKVLAKKPQHNPDFRDYYSCRSYSKIQIDLMNISKTRPQKGVLKNFGFMWNNIDTTDSNHTRLPILFTETSADYYYRREPFSEKEYVLGSKISGFQNPELSRVITDVNNRVNLYGEFLYILNKNFPSPLNDNFKMSYRYYLDDSFSVDGVMHYLINFLPRNSADPGFTGYMVIHGQDYAVTETRMTYRAEGNVNYIRGFDVEMFFSRLPDGTWYQRKQILRADLTFLERNEDIPGAYAQKTSIYTEPSLEKPADPKIFKGENKVIMNDELALSQTDAFWATRRPEQLTEKESAIYRSADTLRKSGTFRILKAVFTGVATGYIRLGPIDLGNVQTFASWNPVEGPRVKLGFRTNRFFSKKFTSEYWAAYGIKDRRFKGGTEMAYFPLGIFKRRHNVGIRAVYDMEQMGLSQNAMQLDNLMTSISRTSKLNRLMLTKEGVVHYEHDWFDGFVTRLSAVYRNVAPQGDFRFDQREQDGSVHSLKHIINTELQFNLRFAYKERRLSGDFKRRIFVNKYPVFSAEVAKGFKGIFGSKYSYWRLKVRVAHRQKVGKLGFIDYMVEGGKIWGNLPYHLLEVHTGNQSFINDDVAFNTMRYFEFVSDQYVAIHVENHFEGFFLNRIPGIKKLKWREFIVNKVLFGRLSNQNKQGPLVFPDGLSGLKQPYWETGFGIENIFKIFRIDFLWRIGPIENKLAKGFHVKPSLYLRF